MTFNYIKKNPIKVFFIGVYLILFFLIILPFLFSNNLYAWDGSGHLAAAEYLLEECFPRFVCWNQHYLLGYPQGQFYPQGLHWLAALLSHIFNISISFSFKILIIIAIILLPFSIFYFLNSFLSKKEYAIFFAFFAFVAFLVSDDYLFSGNFSSLFNIGLYSNFFVMPFFFFFCVSLKHFLEDKRSFILPSIIFSAIILLHIVVALVAVLFFISILVYYLFFIKYKKGNQKENLFYFFKKSFILFISVLLLTSFWTIPFLIKIKYFFSNQISLNISASFLFFLFFFSLFCIAFLVEHSPRELIFPIFLVVLFLFSFFCQTYLKIPFHFYRFGIFILLFLIFSFLSILICLNNKFSRMILFIVLFFSLFFILSQIPKLNPQGVFDQEIFYLEDMPNSRYYLNIPPFAESSPHFIQSIVPQRSNIKSVKGLFIEGSKNGQYVLILERMSHPTNLVWGTYLPFDLSLYTSNLTLNRIYYIFGISNVLSIRNNSISLNKINYYKDRDIPFFNRYNYTLDFVGDNRIIETLNYIPSKLKEPALTWFYKNNDSIFYSYEYIPYIYFEKNATISNISIKSEQISFTTDKFSPVLIRISYYPNWKAYNELGEPINIYEITPSFMLVFSKGKTILRYKSLWYEKILNYLSLISFFTLLIILIFNYFSDKIKFINIPIIK